MLYRAKGSELQELWDFKVYIFATVLKVKCILYFVKSAFCTALLFHVRDYTCIHRYHVLFYEMYPCLF